MKLKETNPRQGCKGCSVEFGCYKNYKLGNLRVYYKNRVGGCPCKICIVKMVCDDTCQDYRTAWNIEGLNTRMNKDIMNGT